MRRYRRLLAVLLIVAAAAAAVFIVTSRITVSVLTVYHQEKQP